MIVSSPAQKLVPECAWLSVCPVFARPFSTSTESASLTSNVAFQNNSSTENCPQVDNLTMKVTKPDKNSEPRMLLNIHIFQLQLLRDWQHNLSKPNFGLFSSSFRLTITFDQKDSYKFFTRQRTWFAVSIDTLF